MDATVWRALARELEERLGGARVARTLARSARSIELRFDATRRGPSVLVLSADAGLPRIEIASRHGGARAPAAAPAPAERRGLLETHLGGTRLEAVIAPDWERELRFVFERAVLVARLVPTRPLLVLLDAGGDPRGSWPVTTLSALTPLAQPPGTRALAAMGPAEIEEALRREPAAPLDEKLRRASFGASPALVREIIHRAGLEPGTSPPLPGPDALRALERAWADVAGALVSTGEGAWLHLPGRPLAALRARPRPEIALVELRHLAGTHEARRFDAVAGAAHAYWRALRETRSGENTERELRAALRRGREHETALIASLESELADAESGPDARRAGELLVAHLGRIAPGAREARVPDWYDPDAREVVIPLDPSLSPEANVDRYFRRARRASRALLEIPSRLDAARARLRRIGEWTARVEAAGSWEELDAIAEASRADAALGPRFAAAARAAGARPPSAPATDPVARRLRHLSIRPRRIALAPGWIALVGRTGRENDVLTTRAAMPHDLWFHARGVAGSHVLVIRPARDAEPPAEVVRRAAIAAAWYSQGRTSSVVAVAWTEARYVRKPRGSAPGLVTLLREKVVMVEPSKPEGAGPGSEPESDPEGNGA